MVRAGFLAFALLVAALGLAERAAAAEIPRRARSICASCRTCACPATCGRAARSRRGAGRRRQRRRHRRRRRGCAPLRRRSADEHRRGLGRIRDRQGRSRVRERRGRTGLPHRRRGSRSTPPAPRWRGSATSTATAWTTSSWARRSPMWATARTRAPRTSCSAELPRSPSASPHPAARHSSSWARAADDRLGSSVAGLPDANGDGRGDLVVGAPRADRPDAGGEGDQAYVLRAAVAQERRSRVRPLRARRARDDRHGGARLAGLPDRGRARASRQLRRDAARLERRRDRRDRGRRAAVPPQHEARRPRLRRLGQRHGHARRPRAPRPARHRPRRRRPAARRRRRGVGRRPRRRRARRSRGRRRLRGPPVARPGRRTGADRLRALGARQPGARRAGRHAA